ncbi:class I SAM-dependent methyltransferase [Stieleria varia]|uniref:Methyltransferase type 11 domain-containing protein n=1 Tax=Stieleria varia TaxID=2528005 RepID=A0A5C6B7J3_9BACT|nr:hypothetical protein [Stieleria varia]TWU08033.1 hypothetical protein Pla52n_06110 [Stieleria varia]
MGLIQSSFRLLLYAQQQGCSFQSVATIGRQQIYLRPDDVRELATEYPQSPLAAGGVDPPWGEFNEPFLKESLGCSSIESIDYSDFEQATLLHDMNQPIGPDLDQRFDAVIDGGTLEHLFNVPVALANYMRMVRVGGCVVLSTNANNHCGHGFYQFSPELLYRVFNAANGFQILKMLVVEHPYPGAELSSSQIAYEVIDPDAIKQRVGLVSHHPILVMALAKRVADVPIFQSMPQQSDYQTRWDESTDSPENSGTTTQIPERPKTAFGKIRRVLGNTKRALERRLPQRLEQALNGQRQRKEYSLQNKQFYRRWKP